ncbi:DNA polymerase III subunit delta' [Haloplasma contractile]|nr:DNA polymerase III subunit delta' [Haloplasma contractile]
MSFEQYNDIQPHIVKMLKNSYKKNRLSHAYLFEGEKGTQKKAIAIEFAKMMYCKDNAKPCDDCLNCSRIMHQNHPNVIVISPDGNTIKKEQILFLQEEYTKTTLEKGPKVYIIEHIDRMSVNAINSLLKFIEEPKQDTYIILITETIHRILPTITSRCQVLSFKTVPRKRMIQYLTEHGTTEEIATIVSTMTNDINVAFDISDDKDLLNIIDLVIEIEEALIKKNTEPLLLLDRQKFYASKNKKLVEWFLDLLLEYNRDIQKVMLGKQSITFQSQKELIRLASTTYNQDKIIQNINSILNAKIKLNYNANLSLLLDQLMITLKT